MKIPSKLTRSESTEKRRLQIVESAAVCFIEKGFHQSSMRDIATKAGVSLGNLYNHFQSKEALIAEIATLEACDLSQLETELEGGINRLEALKSFVKKYLKYCMHTENISLGAEITAEAARNPEIAERFAANRNALSRNIAKCIELGIKESDISAEIDANQAAGFVIDLVESCAFRLVVNGDSPTRKTTKHLLLLIDRYLRCERV